MKKSCAGFTLIELMMVVALIGILASMAVTGLQRLLRHRILDTTAHGLATAMGRARDGAIRDHCFARVEANDGHFTAKQLSGDRIYYTFPKDAASTLDAAVTVTNAATAAFTASDSINYSPIGLLVDGNESPLGTVVVTLTDQISGEVMQVSSDLLGIVTITTVNGM